MQRRKDLMSAGDIIPSEYFEECKDEHCAECHRIGILKICAQHGHDFPPTEYGCSFTYFYEYRTCRRCGVTDVICRYQNSYVVVPYSSPPTTTWTMSPVATWSGITYNRNY